MQLLLLQFADLLEGFLDELNDKVDVFMKTLLTPNPSQPLFSGPHRVRLDDMTLAFFTRLGLNDRTLYLRLLITGNTLRSERKVCDLLEAAKIPRESWVTFYCAVGRF